MARGHRGIHDNVGDAKRGMRGDMIIAKKGVRHQMKDGSDGAEDAK